MRLCPRATDIRSFFFSFFFMIFLTPWKRFRSAVMKQTRTHAFTGEAGRSIAAAVSRDYRQVHVHVHEETWHLHTEASLRLLFLFRANRDRDSSCAFDLPNNFIDLCFLGAVDFMWRKRHFLLCATPRWAGFQGGRVPFKKEVSNAPRFLNISDTALLIY